MKKIYFLASALLAVTTLKAQFTTVDFEDLSLPAVDTFYTGADEAGFFETQDVTFGNFYEETAWGYSWSGFAYSNMTDNVTPGFDNQYSAFAGSGANGSENYAIYYSTDTVTFNNFAVSFGNVAITNTTYAGISMRDGDAFAKQFGSPNGADGEPDGTEGEDYFFVTIYGWDQQWGLVDSTVIYLADYRSADENDHYILKEWENFDLSNLDGSKYLTFNLTSSDVGEFGMNTPAYFAMDNLEYSMYVNSLASNEAINYNAYPNPVSNVLYIEGGEGQIQLSGIDGRIVKTIDHNGSSDISVSDLPKGVYILRLSNQNGAVASKKIIVQ